MSAPLVLRPDPGSATSRRTPFFRNVSMEIDDGHLTVVDEQQVRHRYRIGEQPGEVSHLAIVQNFSVVMPAGQDAYSARSWLLVVDSTNTALVAADLGNWDEVAVHTWWGLVHGGKLEMHVARPGAVSDHVPRTAADRTLLVQYRPSRLWWSVTGLFCTALALPLLPAFTDVPTWVGWVPAFVMMFGYVVAGKVAGRSAGRARAAQQAELESRIPPGRRPAGL